MFVSHGWFYTEFFKFYFFGHLRVTNNLPKNPCPATENNVTITVISSWVVKVTQSRSQGPLSSSGTRLKITMIGARLPRNVTSIWWNTRLVGSEPITDFGYSTPVCQMKVTCGYLVMDRWYGRPTFPSSVKFQALLRDTNVDFIKVAAIIEVSQRK